ncbi:O-glucosyltransferase rumi homolog [Ricinus communis]|uniref:O-glucosyltransferase rumi homolog n=1 Tax=Ricinus communis TaxID=3988 RepID=UPI00201A61EA|nr:O-glucosyltransferase rumi homolog [Ricinus communis]
MKKKNGKSQHRHSTTTTRPWPSSINNVQGTNALVLCFIFFFVGGFLLFTCLDMYVFRVSSFQKASPTPQEKAEFPLRCTATPNITQTCPADYYPKTHNSTNSDRQSNVICPSYFKWIHEDLRPWRETGITRDMIERARRTAHFRLVIVDGRAYVEKYRQSIQTRDMITLWGILQLLRLYPGKVPDLELMFDCDDRPVVRSEDFPGPTAGPPPLFRYCADDTSLDIVFPDWSFWGWAEINIRPWNNLLEDLKEGNNRTKWKDRVPYAHWKGNPYVDQTRQDLLKCNVSDKNEWNTRLYVQDWLQEYEQGYKQSNLQDQCTHRYKIYIEGYAWSVSEKYILACDAMTLYVRPRFYDFYVRGMVPLQHYWPIKDDSKCTSLKFAVDWGNNHTLKAQAIGEAASKFMHEDVKMDYVYDYMFHVLNEYAKLLKFKPTVPPEAAEICSETMACPMNGTHRKFMTESMVVSPSDRTPCALPPPYDPPALQKVLDRKANSIKQVEMWENQYWQNINNKQN